MIFYLFNSDIINYLSSCKVAEIVTSNSILRLREISQVNLMNEWAKVEHKLTPQKHENMAIGVCS